MALFTVEATSVKFGLQLSSTAIIGTTHVVCRTWFMKCYGVCRFVCPSMFVCPTAAKPLLQVYCCGPGRQEILNID